ncbi:hypothetical protein CLV88_11661 [Shimia abyssi]|uniref:Transposase n=1 Tax=Shimia abyssi TaxID=1662395 RepID=A0A2P8F7B9_9RHOB|nr:hypothetical protein CLV88_11661 [Shimia abyssi]
MGTSNYSDEFKRDAVHQITVRGYPVREVSERLLTQRVLELLHRCRIRRRLKAGRFRLRSRSAEWSLDALGVFQDDHVLKSGVAAAKLGYFKDASPSFVDVVQ